MVLQHKFFMGYVKFQISSRYLLPSMESFSIPICTSDEYSQVKMSSFSKILRHNICFSKTNI